LRNPFFQTCQSYGRKQVVYQIGLDLLEQKLMIVTAVICETKLFVSRYTTQLVSGARKGFIHELDCRKSVRFKNPEFVASNMEGTKWVVVN
jgi:hypothetical protein